MRLFLRFLFVVVAGTALFCISESDELQRMPGLLAVWLIVFPLCTLGGLSLFMRRR